MILQIAACQEIVEFRSTTGERSIGYFGLVRFRRVSPRCAHIKWANDPTSQPIHFMELLKKYDPVQFRIY